MGRREPLARMSHQYYRTGSEVRQNFSHGGPERVAESKKALWMMVCDDNPVFRSSAP